MPAIGRRRSRTRFPTFFRRHSSAIRTWCARSVRGFQTTAYGTSRVPERGIFDGLSHSSGKKLRSGTRQRGFKHVLERATLLEDVPLVYEEDNDRKPERNDRLREEVPDVQVLDEDVHEGGVHADARDLHPDIERQLDVQVLAGAVAERPEFLQSEADGERDEERADRRKKVVDVENVGECVEHGEIHREREAARDTKSDKLRILLRPSKKRRIAEKDHEAFCAFLHEKSAILKPALARRKSASVLNVWSEYRAAFGSDIDVCSSLYPHRIGTSPIRRLQKRACAMISKLKRWASDVASKATVSARCFV